MPEATVWIVLQRESLIFRREYAAEQKAKRPAPVGRLGGARPLLRPAAVSAPLAGGRC